MTPRKNRIQLPKSARVPMPGARRVGRADPNQPVEVTVVLRRRPSQRKLPNIESLGAMHPQSRLYLTREQFAEKGGAHPGDIVRIRKFASDFGLQVVSENAARRSVVLAGTVDAFSRAFSVELSIYRHAKGTYRGRTGLLTIPAELKGVIEGVFGLDNRPQAQPHFRIQKKTRANRGPRAATGGYAPTEVAKAYDFPEGLDGTGQSVGILELGGGYQEGDLNSFFSNLGLPTPKVTSVAVDGSSNSPTGDASGPDGEVELDIEVIGAMASQAQIGVYFAPNTDRGFLDGLTTAIHDETLRPSVISVSWGGPESSWTEQAMTAIDSACQDAAAMGVTILVAAGDGGATDGGPSGTLAVDFPSSSPHVIGCGGTKLMISDSRITQEVVWNELAEGEGATGGGVSQMFSLPSWQSSANVPKSPTGKPGRGVPDVSGDADPVTGYQVVVDGSTTVIGGTSAVAPLWAGLFTLMNQSLGKPLGYMNPLLYAASLKTSFHDIVEGNNDGYTAGKGWDPCTGLGTPDGEKLLAAMGSEPSETGRVPRKRLRKRKTTERRRRKAAIRPHRKPSKKR